MYYDSLYVVVLCLYLTLYIGHISQFEEILLWCRMDIELLVSALPAEVLLLDCVVEEVALWRAVRTNKDMDATVVGTPVTPSTSTNPSHSCLGVGGFIILLCAVAVQVKHCNAIIGAFPLIMI